MATSKRALLLLVADIKCNIKMLNIPEIEMDKVYTILHDTLGTLVLLNYSGKQGGGGKHGRKL